MCQCRPIYVHAPARLCVLLAAPAKQPAGKGLKVAELAAAWNQAKSAAGWMHNPQPAKQHARTQF
jgi:hypothetical protein